MIDRPYIDIHTHQKIEPRSGNIALLNLFVADAAKVSESGKQTYCSIGLHPWHISEQTHKLEIYALEQALKSESILALGETGLDRAIKVPMALQKEVFKQHLMLAQLSNKPVIIHAVRTYPDIIEIYNQARVNVKLISHGFNGNLTIARQFIKRGFYLSFGEDLFNSKMKTAEVFKTLPLKNIFLETDESSLDISEIYKQAAEIKKISIPELKAIIYQNFLNCFGEIL